MAADQRCHLANLFLHSLADDDGVAEPIDVRPVKGFTHAFEAANFESQKDNGQMHILSGWWFGTCFVFPEILEMSSSQLPFYQ